MFMPCVRQYWCCNVSVLVCHISFNHFVFTLFYAGGNYTEGGRGNNRILNKININKDINAAYLSGVNAWVYLMDARAAKFSRAFLMASSKLLSAS